MQQENWTKVLRETEQALLHRFISDNVKSAHNVLFDPDGNNDFIPLTDELQSRLEAYLFIVEKAA